MTTQILNLPVLTIEATVSSNEDWLDRMLFAGPDGITPIDLTGIVFHGQLRRAASAEEIVLAFGTVAASLTNGLTTGILSLNVPQASLPQAPGIYDLDIIAAADAHLRVAVNGTVTIVQGVTR